MRTRLRAVLTLFTKSVIIERVSFDARAHFGCYGCESRCRKGRRKVLDRSALGAIEMLVRCEHSIITNNIPLKLHFADFAFFREQVQIAIDGCQRYIPNFSACEPKYLVRRGMRFRAL